MNAINKGHLGHNCVLFECEEYREERGVYGSVAGLSKGGKDHEVMKFPMVCSYCYYLCRDNDHLMEHTCVGVKILTEDELERRAKTWAPEYPIKKRGKPPHVRQVKN